MSLRIAIIGAGITGVSTAYELASDGHAVTVFERRGAIAAESSFGAGALLSPGWLMQLQHTTSRHGRRLRWPGLLARTKGLAFSWRRWQARRDPSSTQQQQELLALSQFSLKRLRSLRRDLQLDYEHSEGVLLLLRTEAELTGAKAASDALTHSGIAHRWLEAEDCHRLEPGLCIDTPLAAGLHLPHDEAGNCREFATLLKLTSQRLGVKFRFHTTVRHIEMGARPVITHEYTPPEDSPTPPSTLERQPSEGPVTTPMLHLAEQDSFDAVVLCTALDDGQLLRQHGIRLPTIPISGCSVTAPLRQLEAHPDLGPRSAVVDLRAGVSISRLGQRVRIAGGWIPFAPASPTADTIKHLHRAMHDWFPGAMQASQTQVWQGHYPMLPDEAPVLGPGNAPGLWLNLAAADQGWSLACGSARWLADQIGQRSHGASAGLSLDKLGISRLR